MPRGKQLTRRDWTLAAMAALAGSGVASVRVERLAETLNTSKGSFYWHFADRAALLEAVLDLWEAEGTADVIADVAPLSDPEARLRAVTEGALVAKTHGIGVAQAEGALREWAAQDVLVAGRLIRVDSARTAFLAAELESLGHRPQQAAHYAIALYLALIGLYEARRYNPGMADDGAFRALLELVLANLMSRKP